MHPGERFNGYTHWLGLALALCGAVLLAGRVEPTGCNAGAAGALVFALSAVALYGASALFHSTSGHAKRFWARADHCAIYLLIAGTCTPFVLIGLSGWTAVVLLTTVWGLALFGIGRELRPRGDAAPSLRLYVGMGWLCVCVAAPLAATLDGAALAGLVAGAAVYSAGTVFYRNRRGWAHAHGVWHLFVLGGTMTHYATVLRLVL
ncbi:PAQR family membrane homeostasis protein TrhA [Variovorax sp. PAMC 28711]|uniref:PAQR family membrane homeostasis protein TrhA n=1 Tax=Variovorax sp. PAMC 28711 TaxID=1795631 RepID=UPI00078D188E|nr:hemolysin III family protein [Variovorax sp. PAMC 28711]AMM26527.1 hemolysin D [Variovorax sp. PAMC 28711]